MRAILAVALLGACIISIDGNGLRDSVHDAHVEESRHVLDARAAFTLPARISETDRYTTRMTVIFDDMHHQMFQLQHCAGMGTLMDMRDAMQDELDVHHDRMHAMTDFATARDEDEDHISVMTSMLDDVDMRLDVMDCPGM